MDDPITWIIVATCATVVGGLTLAITIGLLQNRQHYWLRRANAAEAVQDYPRAAYCCHRAISTWSFTNGPRLTCLRDLARLQAVLRYLQDLEQQNGKSVDIGPILRTIDELKGIFNSGDNFLIDDRSMKPQAAKAYAAQFERLLVQRRELVQGGDV